jgi:hypothetical protein
MSNDNINGGIYFPFNTDAYTGGTAKKRSKKKNNISKATTIHRYSSKPKVDPHVINPPKNNSFETTCPKIRSKRLVC